MKAFVLAVMLGLVGSVSVYAYLGVLGADLVSELQSTNYVSETSQSVYTEGSGANNVGVEFYQGGEDNTVYRVQPATGKLDGNSILVMGADIIAK